METEQSLKLVMLQGPRKGETFEYPPNSTIKIGRVVRGNNLSIKDTGISSKHLIIVGSSDSPSWIIQDLDSSNGTFLNSVQLVPYNSVNLRHGDTIKLGELTSILVQFQEQGKEPYQLRRNPRRKVGGESEAVLVKERQIRKGRPPKGRAINESVVAVKVEIVEEDDAVGVMEKRASRTRKGRVLDAENVEKLKEKKVNNSSRVTEGSVVLESLDGRVTRGRKNNLQELPMENEVDAIARGDKEKGLESGDVRNGIVVKESTVELGVISTKENEAHVNGDEEEEKERLGMEIECEDVVEDSVELGLDSRQEANQQVKEADISGDEEVNCQSVKAKDLGKNKVILDLEKMTLGQWFGYMEGHLSNHIIQTTEDMIAEMRAKAERVKEYIIIQHKEAKAKAVH